MCTVFILSGSLGHKHKPQNIVEMFCFAFPELIENRMLVLKQNHSQGLRFPHENNGNNQHL